MNPYGLVPSGMTPEAVFMAQQQMMLQQNVAYGNPYTTATNGTGSSALPGSVGLLPQGAVSGVCTQMNGTTNMTHNSVATSSDAVATTHSEITSNSQSGANILYIKFVGMHTTEQKIKDVLDDPELINVTIRNYSDSPSGQHRFAELLFSSSAGIANSSQKTGLKVDQVPVAFTTIMPTSFGTSVSMRDSKSPFHMDLNKAGTAAEAAIMAAQRLHQQIKSAEIPSSPVNESDNNDAVFTTPQSANIPRGSVRSGTNEERDCLSRTVCIKGLPAEWDVPRTLNSIIGSLQNVIEVAGMDATSITTSVITALKKDELARSGGKHFALVEFQTQELKNLMLGTEMLDPSGDGLNVEQADQCAREVVPFNVVLGVPGQALIHSVMPGQAIRAQKIRISSKLDIVRKMKERIEAGKSLKDSDIIADNNDRNAARRQVQSTVDRRDRSRSRDRYNDRRGGRSNSRRDNRRGDSRQSSYRQCNDRGYDRDRESNRRSYNERSRTPEKSERRRSRTPEKSERRRSRTPEKAERRRSRTPEKAERRRSRTPEKAERRRSRTPEKSERRRSRTPETRRHESKEHKSSERTHLRSERSSTSVHRDVHSSTAAGIKAMRAWSDE